MKIKFYEFFGFLRRWPPFPFVGEKAITPKESAMAAK
jgi:hypothetical protein